MATPRTVQSVDTEAKRPGEFDRLRRFILYHLGGFTLGLVRVNDPHQRDGVIDALRGVLAAAPLRQAARAGGARLIWIDLANLHPTDLRSAVLNDPNARAALANDPAHTALAIAGMEHLIEAEAGPPGRPPFAAALNIERDAIPETLPVPVILFLTDHAMDRLDLAAPDFFDWYSGVFRLRPPAAEMVTEQAKHTAEPRESYAPTLSPDTLGARLELLEQRRKELEQAGPQERPRLGQVLKELGDLYAELPEYQNRQASISFLKQAAEIFHEEDRKADEAAALEQLGGVYYWINNYEQANRRYRAALPIYRDIGARLGEANCIQSLGDVHRMLDEYAQARQRYEEALPIYRDIGARLGEANTYTAFGDLGLIEEKHAQARDWFGRAWNIYEEIGDRHWRTYVATRLARALLALGEMEQAVRVLKQGEALARSIDGQPNLRAIQSLLNELPKK